jgi:hypothetical protein
MPYFASLFTCRGLISRPTDAAFSVRSGLQLFTQGNGGFLVSPCSTHLHLVGRGPNLGGPGCPKLHTVIGTLVVRDALTVTERLLG